MSAVTWHQGSGPNSQNLLFLFCTFLLSFHSCLSTLHSCHCFQAPIGLTHFLPLLLPPQYSLSILGTSPSFYVVSKCTSISHIYSSCLLLNHLHHPFLFWFEFLDDIVHTFYFTFFLFISITIWIQYLFSFPYWSCSLRGQ